MRGALSLRQAEAEYGVNRRRLAGMVDRGELAADTSRPGLVLIPRTELERRFGTLPAFDPEALRQVLEPIIAHAVAEGVALAFGLLSDLPRRPTPAAGLTSEATSQKSDQGGNPPHSGRVVRLRTGQNQTLGGGRPARG